MENVDVLKQDRLADSMISDTKPQKFKTKAANLLKYLPRLLDWTGHGENYHI